MRCLASEIEIWRAATIALTIPPILLVHGAAVGGPLHDAAKSGNLAAIEKALKQGTKVNGRDDSGTTALFYATAANRLKVVKRLLDRGAKPDTLNMSAQGPADAPIHAAAKAGNLEAIRLLAAAKADLTLATIQFAAPLHLTLKHKRKEAAALLRKLGAGDFKAPSVRAMLAKADLKLGKDVAEESCKLCHAVQKNGKPTGGYGSIIGPTLWNVVGRKMAAHPGGKYSAAMRAAKGVWGMTTSTVTLPIRPRMCRERANGTYSRTSDYARR